jgi:hypothetical protein
VLNPFLAEEDLLRLILQEFGVVSRDEIKRGHLLGVSKAELIETLNEFLLSLQRIGAQALLIIDEAQNLPLQVLEQIRILSNLETEKEKLLQIVLVGQSNLKDLLRRAELRQLDQRVSIRYDLQPLSREETAAYVQHRLSVAGGGAAVTFTPKSTVRVHRYTSGIPRLINLICDRALLAGFAERSDRISAEMVKEAAETLDVQQPALSPNSQWSWLARRAPLVAAAAVVLLACAMTVGVSAFVYERFAMPKRVETAPPVAAPVAAVTPAANRTLPSNTAFTILVGAYPLDDPQSAADIRSTTEWLEATGLHVYYAPIESGSSGRWQRVLAGAYADDAAARADADKLKTSIPAIDPQVVAASASGGPGAAPPHATDILLRRAGMNP